VELSFTVTGSDACPHLPLALGLGCGKEERRAGKDRQERTGKEGKERLVPLGTGGKARPGAAQAGQLAVAGGHC
jgi:hypothetical protein